MDFPQPLIRGRLLQRYKRFSRYRCRTTGKAIHQRRIGNAMKQINAAAIIVLLLAGALVGFGTRPFIDWVLNQSRGGSNVRCVAGKNVCVGAPPSDAFSYRVDDEIGGVIDVYCGFDRPGEGGGHPLSIPNLIKQGCKSNKYALRFSNGRRLTTLWVENNRIVRIDDHPRHTIDP